LYATAVALATTPSGCRHHFLLRIEAGVFSVVGEVHGVCIGPHDDVVIYAGDACDARLVEDGLPADDTLADSVCFRFLRQQLLAEPALARRHAACHLEERRMI